jgi:hypothetical protein
MKVASVCSSIRSRFFVMRWTASVTWPRVTLRQSMSGLSWAWAPERQRSAAVAAMRIRVMCFS